MVGILTLIIIIIILVPYIILKSPFSYPYFTYRFNVSGKRGPHIEDYLDNYLISGGFVNIQAHQKMIEQWKLNCQQRIEKSI